MVLWWAQNVDTVEDSVDGLRARADIMGLRSSSIMEHCSVILLLRLKRPVLFQELISGLRMC